MQTQGLTNNESKQSWTTPTLQVRANEEKRGCHVPWEDRKEQLLSCGVRLGKFIFLGRFVAIHQKLKCCLCCKFIFQWLSVHILLGAVCMHQCGDWPRLWTPRKKICARLALLLKEVKAHAQRDWGGWDCSLLKTQKQAAHYLTKYAYDEVSSVVCIR